MKFCMGWIWNHISKVKPVELGLMNLGCSYISIHSLVREFENERLRNSVRCVANTKRRWSIKQAKRSRKRIGSGYQSRAYTQATRVPPNMDENCIVWRE